jgi:squalene-hopene/tetraprenyl-beta-curcumene cyclase
VPAATIDFSRLRAALEKATAALLAERNERGFWEGELSSSALSTATAVTALAIARKHGAASDSQISNLKSQIELGLQWLAANANPDGGWGDTTKSLSNISTTTLCWAAFGAANADEEFAATVCPAEQWLAQNAGSIDPDKLSCAIIARYGKDRTFSVPILTMCALAGRLGSGRDAWRHVIPLPFELAACPHQLFAALRLPVVSYALPALIAIGQARHIHAPSNNPIARAIRNATRQKTLRVLAEIQPANGGFLEATPLTSFVTMSLAGSGQPKHIVTQRGLEFLLKSQRADGSWPIDTNLATWCTTLAIEALPLSPQSPLSSQLGQWLLAQQYRVEHPYTHAAPGGWAWTDLPGGVPDADDTAGALLALAQLGNADGSQDKEILPAAETGIRWLLKLQNRDGGVPTFCRGWGALPFDRSSADITAHALRAWTDWKHAFDGATDRRMRAARLQALKFLRRTQKRDGSWLPLWFGNQHVTCDENPTYGTARVVKAIAQYEIAADMLGRAVAFLLSIQNADGSWSGKRNSPASVEETALALEALAVAERSSPQAGDVRKAIACGTEWLVVHVENGGWREPSPIGFYFAKLWYSEKLYPLIFTVGALRAVADLEGVE